jgi:hypothetical protein
LKTALAHRAKEAQQQPAAACGRLRYKAIWEPTLKDYWERWVYLAERWKLQAAANPNQFDRTTMIRIEFPYGYSQASGRYIYEKQTRSDGLAYQVKDNILEFRGNHYRLKIGDIARLELSGTVLIYEKQAMSFEDVCKIVTAPLTTKCAWICAIHICSPEIDSLKE